MNSAKSTPPKTGHDERKNREYLEHSGDRSTDAAVNPHGSVLMAHTENDREDEHRNGHTSEDEVRIPPTDSGHSDAATQTERNAEDESPS